MYSWLSYSACKSHHFCVLIRLSYFSTLSHKRHDFWKKKNLNTKCVFLFYRQLFHSVKNSASHLKCISVLTQNSSYLVRFTSNLNFLDGFSIKFSNIRLHENVCSGSWVVPSRQTDGTKPIVPFRNFANALIISKFRNLFLACSWPDRILRKKRSWRKSSC